MTDSEEQCLAFDDLKFFNRGACHLFAVALQDSQPLEKYDLVRLSCLGINELFPGYHVGVRSGDFLVDVGGIRRLQDYLDWLRTKRTGTDFGRPDIPVVSTHAITRDEVLKVVREDKFLGPVNQWDLFARPEFVERALVRANAVIEFSPEKYRASLVKGSANG